MATEVCMPANLSSVCFCPILGRWERVTAPRMLRKFLLMVLVSRLRTLPVQTLTPGSTAHTGSLCSGPLILMNIRLSLLTLSVGVSTESGSAVQDGAFLTLFSTLSMPHHQVCMYKCSFPDLLEKSSFFYSKFCGIECFHKGSCLGWNEVILLGQRNKPFSEMPAMRWALPAPELPLAHGMLLSHVCGFPESGPLLVHRKLPKGDPNLA